jgi:sulfatase modifying factor 1
MKFSPTISLLAMGALALASCSSSKRGTATNPGKNSSTTGLEYNTEEGMKVSDFKKIPTGPGLVHGRSRGS